MHDITAARVDGINMLPQTYPTVRVLVDAGYQGLARDHPHQVTAPPLRLRPGALPARQADWEANVKPGPPNEFRSSTRERFSSVGGE
jgi:hypothetical protein